MSVHQFAHRLHIILVFSKRTPRLHKSWTSDICFLDSHNVSNLSFFFSVHCIPNFHHDHCRHLTWLLLPTALSHHAPDSCRPMLEMTIPSVLDPTLAPPGCHVVSLFTQFTPYHIEGKEWTQQDREAFADTGIAQKYGNS